MQENENEKLTGAYSSAGTDLAQSLHVNENGIADFIPDVKKKCDPKQIQLSMTKGYIETKTMRELYDQLYEPRVMTINGFLCPGLYLFVGDPKIGKSFCMLQMAYNVSRGEPFLGFEVPCPSPVLYLALEDTDERLQDRLFKMFGTQVTDNLHFANKANKLDEDLLEQLNTFMGENPQMRLIIIDTLQKTRKETANPCNYSADYEAIGKLKAFADERKISMILVHHMRKQDSGNKADMISGTNGLYGASDGAFLMYRKGVSPDELVIETECRDLPHQIIHIVRDPIKLTFNRTDDADTIVEPKDGTLEKVAALVSSNIPSWVGTATQLLSDTGIEMKPSALSYYLNIRSRKLFSDYRIRYEKGRTSQARAIRLTWIPPIERHDTDDANDEDDSILGSKEVTS